MSAGRPTDYNYELVKSICTRISEGEKLPNILKEEGMPVRSTFYKWKRENKEFSDLYVNVAHDKGELCVEEIDSTIEDLKAAKIDASTANVIIQALKWKAAKFYPKMYGEKVDVTSGGEKLPNPQPVAFISVDKLTDEQLEKYIQANAGGNNESI
jgi:hypothetical protein